ncbi:Glycosyl hydrolase family 3 [Halomicronema hongdechloris C2206]|uniref:beta-N-acetylhexosaminidase n=1 Tax=Halomicronema hongdechloris C2206 TaxID=1641165 RepID=A0A1Z3HTZ9_9CYAN|nr:glycoside hydrolase family 3 N-terminal domain-containing protein [Halomicronema hongdechloris]ASC73769.1 Glycosyl hydrolase family 3 [Halomicronema hongdechloris C2206]
MILPALPSPSNLPLRQQVAQMVVVRASGHLFDHEIRYPRWEATQGQLQRWIQEVGVGGVILLGGSAAEIAMRSHTLQTWADIPLLLAADIEEGVGQRFSGATWFPPPMALGAWARHDWEAALAQAEKMGSAIAQEAAAIGLNWILAPVVDVNINSENPVINVRAFGQSPIRVSRLAQGFIRGTQAFPVLTTAKHFPGHGDTSIDSHLALPVIPHDRQRLEQIELPPFRAAIAAGVDAVMTAHLRVPQLDQRYPATLSPAILTDLLRQELGFDGLIVTDALVMQAITKAYGPYEAAILAVEAGADVLLMPADPDGVIAALCEAVQVGRLSAERILTSVERIWRAKQKLGTPLSVFPGDDHAWERLPPPPMPLEQLAQLGTRQTAETILRHSMSGQGSLAPQAPGPKQTVIIVDDVIDCRVLSRSSDAIALPQRLGYDILVVDNGPCQQWPHPDALQLTLLQLFIRGNPFRGSAGTTAVAHRWFHALMGSQSLQGLVIYGSPYALYPYHSYLPHLPHVFTYGQMPMAQTLALTALFDLESQPQPSTDLSFTD